MVCECGGVWVAVFRRGQADRCVRRDVAGCVLKMRRNDDCVVIGDAKAARIKTPVMISTQGYAVAWVVIVEVCEGLNMSRLDDTALGGAGEQTTHRAGVVINRADDLWEQRMAHVIFGVVRSLFNLLRSWLALCFFDQFL